MISPIDRQPPRRTSIRADAARTAIVYSLYGDKSWVRRPCMDESRVAVSDKGGHVGRSRDAAVR